MQIKHGTVDEKTGLVFWARQDGREIWLEPKRFQLRREKARQTAKNLYWKDPEKSRAKLREYHHANKEMKSASFKNWAEKNKAKVRNTRLKRIYGISQEDYSRMLFEQNFVCAICGCENTSKDRNGLIRDLCVDHCHTTGRVRGLLCINCNVAIGKMKDNVAILQNAINYLSNNSPASNL